jgi:arabinofuranan 3-O-arabinosyltransferase
MMTFRGEPSRPRILTATSAIAPFIRTVRLLAATLGVALLVLLGFIPESIPSDRIAILAFGALVIASVMACAEVLSMRRAFGRRHWVNDASSVRSGAWIAASALVVGGSILAVQTWFRAGASIAGADNALPNGVAWIGRLFSPWVWSGSDLGSQGTLEMQLPWAVVVGLVHLVGGNAELAQRIWYTALFTASAVGALLLLKTLGTRPTAATLGAAVYVLNPYVVTFVPSPVYLLALALAVLLPACVLAAAHAAISVRTAVILLGVSAPFLGYVYFNPPLVGMLLAVVMASPIVAWWLWGAEAGARGLRTAIFGLGLLIIASAYWIIPAALQLHAGALNSLTAATSWTWTESRATISNAFWLNTAWGWNFPEYYPYAAVYSVLPLSFLKFLLPAVAFSSLYIVGRNARGADSARLGLPIVGAASMAALFLLLFSNGTRPPGNWLFEFFYQLPFGWLLREPGRFLMLAGLAYSILVAALANQLTTTQLIPSWTADFRQHSLGPAAAILLGGAISLGPGFPLTDGHVVSDVGTTLSSMHVRLPDYWNDMSAYIDRAPYDGAVVVFPPDDFYQMPYTWGYYGTDGFIPYLMSRPALIPNAQGYFATSSALTTAVDLTATSLLQNDWEEVDRLLQSLRAPLVLVRGDINSGFPGRSIIDPALLLYALKKAPNFTLVHQAGPLALFATSSDQQPRLGIAQSFATTESATPDLRALSILPRGTSLVAGPALQGITRLYDVPQLSSWDLQAGELRYSMAEPVGWRYEIGLFNTDQPAAVVDPSTEPKGLMPFVAGSKPDQVGSQNFLSIALPLGRNEITSGAPSDFRLTKLSGCNGIGDNPPPGIEVRLTDGPNGLPATRLTSSAGSVCETRDLSWQGGSVLIDLWIRHVSGASPRVCVFEIGPDQCASSPTSFNGIGWVEYKFEVKPDAGTTAIGMILYADADPSGARTVNDYAGVAAYSVPSTDLMLVGYPSPSTGASAVQLLVLHETYSSDWVGPDHARHILVDGIMNGWLVSPGEQGLSTTYAPATLVSLSQLLSLVVFALILAVALYTLPLRALVRRRLRA